MKINISFDEFKKNHSNNKHQVLFKSRSCKEYYKVENLFKFLLAEKNSFIFESVEKGKIKGRYTIIGLNPDKIWDINKNTATISSFGKKTKIKVKPLFFINKLIKEFNIKIPKQLPFMSSMLVGYFSYDVIRYIENIPDQTKDDLKIPDVRLSRPKNLVIYDNFKKKIHYIENVYSDTRIKDYKETYNSIISKFVLFENYENITIPEKFTFKKNKNLVKSNISKQKFKSLVEKAKKYIKRGDIFQVVLSQRFERRIEKRPIEIYNYLRKSNPSPFMFYFNYDDFNILGSSPEILVRLRKGEVTIRPIAGTRPRGRTFKEDKKYELDLLKDKKELAEHLMLLDLGRNDVGKVSEINSVKVNEKFKVERYSHVMHIVSNVVGKFNNKFSLFETLLSGFPAGTVSGAPKIRAMEIIDELEKNKRKLYAGGIGYFTPNGEFDTCIALRTALIKNNKFYVQAGAGIVADSKADKEYAETVNKAKALMKAIDWMKILLIDNYDSFTYNLYHYISNFNNNVDVVRNDKIDSKIILRKKYSKIVISPGPGNPNQAGNCLKIVKDVYKKIPILGVCLGHQIIGQVFGGRIVNAKNLMHGKTSKIKHQKKGLFKNIQNNFEATRYHSLIVDRKSFPKNLVITAETKNKTIMGLMHKDFNIHGFQFHPESISTKIGMKLIKNFIAN